MVLPLYQSIFSDLAIKLSPFQPEIGRIGNCSSIKPFFQPTFFNICFISSLISVYLFILYFATEQSILFTPIINCFTPNKLIRIQERIKSRFSGGLVIDIQQPDYELRYKIIKLKTDELRKYYSNQLNISDEIQKFLSTEIKNSIRELVGSLNRIVSFSRIYNKTPNLSETKIVLKDLLNLPENKITIDLIQSLVCKFFKISKNEMLSARRSRYLVRPRQTAIYLTKILTSKSLPEIGREFSNRDHTTVIHSIKTIENLKKNDYQLYETIYKSTKNKGDRSMSTQDWKNQELNGLLMEKWGFKSPEKKAINEESHIVPVVNMIDNYKGYQKEYPSEEALEEEEEAQLKADPHPIDPQARIRDLEEDDEAALREMVSGVIREILSEKSEG